MLKKKLLLPVVLAVLIAAIFVWGQENQAPDVTFTLTDGKKVAMSALQGKVVLVNFWATDCKSCVNEMPDLINIYNQYKDQGFELIAVAMPYDPPAQLSNFISQKQLPFPVMHDGFSEITQKFGNVMVTPTAMLFDKNGKRLFKKTGTLDFAKLETLLEQHL